MQKVTDEPVLKLDLTDGHSSVAGMALVPITDLTVASTPGVKVLV